MKHVPVLKIDTIKTSNIYKICDFFKNEISHILMFVFKLQTKIKLDSIVSQ